MTDDEPILIRTSETSQEDAPPPGDPHAEFEATMVDRRTHAHPTLPIWERPWSEVRGICLHQTACEMGESETRYDRLNIHFVVTRTGKILRLYDLTTAVCGGNGWNNQCVQIEFDGLYPGLEDDPSTVQVNEAIKTTWDDPSTPFRETPQQVTTDAMERGRHLVQWIDEEVRRNGGQLRVIVAHRQSSGDRPTDPGEMIWKEVAVPMHDTLQLSDGGIGFKLEDGAGGKSIPEQWDPRCVGIPY